MACEDEISAVRYDYSVANTSKIIYVVNPIINIPESGIVVFADATIPDLYDLGLGGSCERIRTILSYLERDGYLEKKDKTVLDVGSGTGNVSIAMAPKVRIV